MLDGAAAREQTERRLELAEDRRLARGEAHVARQHELAARGADATLDLRDRDEPARAQMAKQKGNRRFAGQLRCLRPVLPDPGQVDVGDEVVRIGALEHEHLDGVVGLGALNEGDQIADQFGAEEIHRRRRDRRRTGRRLSACETLSVSRGEPTLGSTLTPLLPRRPLPRFRPGP